MGTKKGRIYGKEAPFHRGFGRRAVAPNCPPGSATAWNISSYG